VRESSFPYTLLVLLRETPPVGSTVTPYGVSHVALVLWSLGAGAGSGRGASASFREFPCAGTRPDKPKTLQKPLSQSSSVSCHALALQTINLTSSTNPPRVRHPLLATPCASVPCGREQKTNFFGEHQGITCDGCGCVPIIGYRYRCKKCPNHDICETCHERWDFGNGSMANGLAKQTISSDAKDHDFFVHKERGFKPLVKTQGPTKKAAPKLKVGRAWKGWEDMCGVWGRCSQFDTCDVCCAFLSHASLSCRACWGVVAGDPGSRPTTRARAGPERS